MKKIETIWHYLLNTAIDEKRFKFQQKQIADHFSFSLSTVHHALEVPTGQGAVRKEGKFFVLQDWRKLLYYWASVRSLAKDVIAQAWVDESVVERESLALPNTVFAAYSAAKHWLGEAPADYERVYFYLPQESLEQWQERFGGTGQTFKQANIIALKQSAHFLHQNSYTSLPLTFVDIWNLPDWYATDFTAALEEKINELLS